MNKSKPKPDTIVLSYYRTVSSDTEQVQLNESLDSTLKHFKKQLQQTGVRRNPNIYRFKLMRRKGPDKGHVHGIGRSGRPGLASPLKTFTKVIVPQREPLKYKADMAAVTTILHRLVRPDAVQPWLNRRLPALGRRKPIDMIRKGDVQRVIELLTQVEEGIHI